MALQDMIGDYGFVAKVNVSNMHASFTFYMDQLGFEYDPRFSVNAGGKWGPGSWMQFRVLGENVAIGIYNDPGHRVGSGGAVATLVVDDIAATRDALMGAGVHVGPIYTQRTDEGDTIREAWFSDPDGNQLGIRQNDMVADKPRKPTF